MMLTLMILALPATDAGLMNRTEHQALLRLRDAQPTPLCSRLMTWTDSKDPCTWAGITCNEGEAGKLRRVTVIDLRYCGIATLLADVCYELGFNSYSTR